MSLLRLSTEIEHTRPGSDELIEKTEIKLSINSHTGVFLGWLNSELTGTMVASVTD